MTVSNQISRSGPYLADGIVTTFNRTFKLLDASHIRVVQTVAGVDTDITTGFTQTGVPGDTGTVVFNTAPANGAQITLYRVVPVTQESDYSSQGSVDPEVIERDLDLVVMRQQDQQDSFDRALVAPRTEPTLDLTIPAVSVRAGMYAGYDGLGKPTALAAPTGTSITTAYTQSLLETSDAAAARTVLAAVGAAQYAADLLAYKSLPSVTIYTSGSGTYTPPAGVKSLMVTCVGGGGGGGGVNGISGDTAESAPGGGGGVCKKFIASPAASYSYAVGAGGAGGPAGANAGSAGGATTFSGGAVSLTANGGGAGFGTSSSGGTNRFSGGPGGTATGGDLNMSGSPGMDRGKVSGVCPILPISGSAPGFGGNVRGDAADANGVDGGAPGAGGSGARTSQLTDTNYAGGAGAAGIIIIEEFF